MILIGGIPVPSNMKFFCKLPIIWCHFMHRSRNSTNLPLLILTKELTNKKKNRRTWNEWLRIMFSSPPHSKGIFTMEQDPTFPTDGPTDGHDSMLYEAPLAPNVCCKRTKWECPGEIPKDCANTRCEKKIHDICYRHFVYNELEERTELVSPHTKEHLVVCSRTCYNKVLRNFSTMATKRIPWNKDAPDNNPSQTSEKILIEWLTTEGNYNKYRGWRNHGTTKHTFAKEISALMVSAGVKSNRTPQSIMDKIAQLEKQFTVASDWLNKTGQGLQGIESEKSIEESVKKRCPHYYDLLMTFGDRAKVRPTVTSEDLLSSEGEEEEDVDSPDIMVGTDIYTPAAKPLKKSASSSTAGKKNKKRKWRMSQFGSCEIDWQWICCFMIFRSSSFGHFRYWSFILVTALVTLLM